VPPSVVGHRNPTPPPTPVPHPCSNCVDQLPLRARLTATTAERFFRIDRALEPAHYVTDIASHDLDLYIVDPDLQTSFLAPAIVYDGAGEDALAAAAGSPWLRGISRSPHLPLTAANGTADGDDIHYARYDNGASVSK